MLQIILIFMIIAALTLGIDPIQRIVPIPWRRRLNWTVFVVYILGNLYFTLFSRVSGSGTYFDPRPFGTYLRLSETIDANFQNTTGLARVFLKDISSFTAVVLNVFLYYPLGYLLTLLFPGLKPWKIVLIGLAASFGTELTQHLMKMGWCETDDILCNSLGTAIGMYVRILQNSFLTRRK